MPEPASESMQHVIADLIRGAGGSKKQREQAMRMLIEDEDPRLPAAMVNLEVRRRLRRTP